MSDIFFKEMHIPQPHYNLHVGGGMQGAMTGRMLEKIEAILVDEKPDYVLIYGDTNSTLAGALATVKLHIPVVHVEAGLRSFNMNMPEEINRILSDRVSKLLLCPTETAVKNLQAENITDGVYNVGDVMYDAVKFYGSIVNGKKFINTPLEYGILLRYIELKIRIILIVWLILCEHWMKLRKTQKLFYRCIRARVKLWRPIILR